MKRLLSLLIIVATNFSWGQNIQDFSVGSPKTWPQAKIDAWYAMQKSIASQAALPDRRDAIISGNQIRTIIWDHGSIGQPGREPSLEWPAFSTHGYAYEFGPFVGIEVPVDANGHFMPYFDDLGDPVAHDTTNPDWAATYHIISDGLRDGGGGASTSEAEPGTGIRWQFEPTPGFVNEAQNHLAVSDDQSTWPLNWTGWPGTYQVGAATADQAAFFVMDDQYNLEFTTDRIPPFYPFPEDTTIGGLGLWVDVRVYQWSNPLANDAIFFVYAITNTSDNAYEKVVFGMFGDPHIGGSQDFSDDWALFDKRINMVYGYDADNKGQWGGATGWMGYMFLESPGNAADGIDNDGDGLIGADGNPWDESMFDGIDNDGDWDPLTDDVGVDGVGPSSPFYPGPDFGEGDGLPTAGDRFDPLSPGEPNFDGTDLDESDQIGLTSFNAAPWGQVAIKEDIDIWNRVRPIGVVDSTDAFTDINQNSDNVFIYGSGYFPLGPGETQRFSVGLLMGEDERDLFNTASIVQRIYNSGYRFAKAPDRPNMSAAAGDGEVTLYWDNSAEGSWDPVYGYDFEGYSIYRATDPGFEEIHTITDNNGNAVLWKPLARYDLINGVKGESAVGIRGVHFDLGNDTGLRHQYVDRNVINGITYYYAVVSYDFGDTTAQVEIPPTESTKKIKELELTGVLVPDPNVAIVVPRGPAPGTIDPSFSISHSGAGTGAIEISIMDPALVKDGVTYAISFDQPIFGPADTVLYVTDLTGYSQEHFVSNSDWFRISDLHLHVTDISVYDISNGSQNPLLVLDSLYTLNPVAGTIRFVDALLDVTVNIEYHYQPLWQNHNFESEDANTVFDGMRLFIQDDPISISEDTGWLVGSTTYEVIAKIWDTGTTGEGFPNPHSYELVWQDQYVNSWFNPSQSAPFILYDVTYKDNIILAPYFLQGDDNGRFVLGQTTIGIFSEAVVDPANKTWQIIFSAPTSGDVIAPQPGDVYQLRITRPFGPEDEFLLTTAAGYYDPDSVANPLDKIAVVPNPYLAQSLYEPRSGFASGRGDREVQFINLPPMCNIRIYTIAGDLVNTIKHNEPFWNGRESYNLLNKEQMEIAFGIYIWHVDASESGLGEKIGKFAVIK